MGELIGNGEPDIRIRMRHIGKGTGKYRKAGNIEFKLNHDEAGLLYAVPCPLEFTIKLDGTGLDLSSFKTERSVRLLVLFRIYSISSSLYLSFYR